MQAGVESVGGWLGLIMGDKITVHFMKNEFGECMRRLKGEIDMHYKAFRVPRNPHPVPVQTTARSLALLNTAAVPDVNEAAKWNAVQVEDWFKKNDLNMILLKQLKPCDGALLNQL
jgi:hypothetical protein